MTLDDSKIKQITFHLFKLISLVLFILLLCSCGKKVNKNKANKDQNSLVVDENPLLGPINESPLSPKPNEPKDDPASAKCSSQNLIWNPSFEEHADQKKNSKKSYQAIPNWQNNVLASTGFEIYYHKTIGKLKAHSGKSMLELDGKAGKKGDSGIYQQVQTRPGASYILKFYYAGNNRIFHRSNIVKVYWNSYLIAQISNTKRKWQSFEFYVTALDEISSLSFKSKPDRGSKGGLIDTVSLIEICQE